MLRVHNLVIGYPARRGGPPTVVARGLDLALHRGDLVCLLGPNGAGKSTLMRTLAGLQAPLAGRVLVDGEDVHAMSARDRARRVAVVLTDRVDVGLFSARELVALGRHPHTRWTGTLSDHDRDVIEQVLEQVGASGLADRAVVDLSDGERQRVMVARALAQEPTLMVLDEITAFLDLPRRVEVMALLLRLARRAGCAVLLSTHDLELATRSADRLWVLSDSGAMACGAPEDLVLSGALGRAFTSQGLAFDSRDGSFRASSNVGGIPVELIGEGVEAHWTRRALERAGCEVRVAGVGAPTRVFVPLPTGARMWSLERGGERLRLGSLEELVGAITTPHGGRT